MVLLRPIQIGDMMYISNSFSIKNECTFLCGDCFSLLDEIPDSSVDLVITSPPYCIGKSYENKSDDLEVFRQRHLDIFPQIVRILKDGGSMCWQVCYHVHDNCITPLDFFVYDCVVNNPDPAVSQALVLRNRIVWTFGHGLNTRNRFSGRYETIMWFTKGNNYCFNLDAVRIPQKYPGKKYYKGKKKGEFSGNPNGKNPSDVWEIPNVKANHIEKTDHPCQFPIAIPQRLIKALTNTGDLVLDPFAGVCTTGAAAIMEGRRFVGSEKEIKYFEEGKKRLIDAKEGTLRYREDKPVYKPNPRTAVARRPDNFKDWGVNGFGPEEA